MAKKPPPQYPNQFLRAAMVHEEAARLLLGHCPERALSKLAGEVIYLSGYVAECSLKSQLFRWTPKSRWQQVFDSFKNPRGLGHDLEKLRLALRRLGCPILEEMNQHLYLIGSLWSTQLRYDPVSRLPNDAKAVFEAAAAILNWAKE